MSRTPKRSPRDRDRDVRMTRTQGARRALRARQATGVKRRVVGSPGRRLALGKRGFPASERVTTFAERIKRLARPGA